jgi:S-adenosylmethionine synthetase
MVAAGLADQILVQVGYAIGVAEPVGIFVNTYGTSKVKLTDGEIGKKIEELFDMRPYFIEKRLKLRSPMYLETASYGHMGRDNKIVKKEFVSQDGKTLNLQVELFTWEKLDFVEKIKEHFNI